MSDILSLLSSLRQMTPEFISNFCIVNGSIQKLDDIENMGWKEYSLRSRLNMPLHLYKYFPNTLTEQKNPETQEIIKTNYSHKSILNNEVFLNTPLDFDDVYDSDISISFENYSRDRLLYYASLCGCDFTACKELSEMAYQLSLVLFQALSSGKSMLSVFNTESLSKSAKLTLENFTLCIENALLKNTEWNNAIAQAVQIEYNDLIRSIRNTFRISCFTTTPFSQRMWGSSYADNHRGFCVEYQIIPDDPKYQQIINNLFPVIYCKKRSDIEKQLIHWQDDLTEESLWSIYSHGVLRKSIDWGDQNEWRLLLPGAHNQGGFTVPFFPISKIYLGNRMDHQHRKELIDICHSKNIPYIGVSRDSDWYEMQECPVLCENCSNYLSFIKRKEQS